MFFGNLSCLVELQGKFVNQRSFLSSYAELSLVTTRRSLPDFFQWTHLPLNQQ